MAIWKLAKQNFKRASLKNYSLIKELHFDLTRKKMSVVVKDEEKLLFIAKGAPELILVVSTHVWRNNGLMVLQDKKAAKRLCEEY